MPLEENENRNKPVKVGTSYFLVGLLGFFELLLFGQVSSQLWKTEKESSPPQGKLQAPLIPVSPQPFKPAAVYVEAQPGLVTPRQGDLRQHGGTPTVRAPFTRRPDDPATTNDESNDQPLGEIVANVVY